MNTEKLNALKERAYKTAVEHGFHEDVKPDVFYLGLVMSEAGEAINADRKGLHADTKAFEEDEAKGITSTATSSTRVMCKTSFATVSETTTSQPSMPSTTTTPCPTASVIASSRSRNSNVPSATCARRPSTPSAPTIC